MKKTIRILLFILMVCIVATVGACDCSSDNTFTLNAKNLELEIGETFVVEIVSDNQIDAVYESENDDIVTVSDEGLITGIAEGTTKVNVSVGKNTQSIRVVVKPKTAKGFAFIQVDKQTLNLYEQDTFVLTCNLIVGDEKIEDVTFNWESSNDEIVSVVNGKISAKKVGQANVKVTLNYQGVTLEKIITVTVIPLTTELFPLWDENQVLKGQSLELECMAVNGKTPIETEGVNFEWNSENKDIADIRNGKLIGLKKGIAKITIKGVIGNETVLSEHEVRVREEYLVTFKNEGRSVKTIKVLDGERVDASYDTNLAGYEFKSWTQNGKAFDFNTEIQSNQTLDASWYKSIEILKFNKSASGIVHEWKDMFQGTAVFNPELIGPDGIKGVTEISVKCHEKYSGTSNVMRLGSFNIADYKKVTYYLKPDTDKVTWAIKETDSKPAICSSLLIYNEWNKVEIVPAGKTVTVLFNDKIMLENFEWVNFSDYQLSLYNGGEVNTVAKVGLSAVYGRYDYQEDLAKIQNNLNSAKKYMDYLNMYNLYLTEYEQTVSTIPQEIVSWFDKNKAIEYDKSKGNIKPEWEGQFGGSVSFSQVEKGPTGKQGVTEIKVLRDKTYPNSANVLYLDSLSFDAYSNLTFYLKPTGDVSMMFVKTGADTPKFSYLLVADRWNSIEIIPKNNTVEIIINGTSVVDNFEWNNFGEYRLGLYNTGEIGSTEKVYMSAVYGIKVNDAPVTPPVKPPVDTPEGSDPFEEDYIM